MLLSSVSLLFVFQTETPPKSTMMKIAASLTIAVICATLFVATDAANDGYSGKYDYPKQLHRPAIPSDLKVRPRTEGHSTRASGLPFQSLGIAATLNWEKSPVWTPHTEIRNMKLGKFSSTEGATKRNNYT